MIGALVQTFKPTSTYETESSKTSSTQVTNPPNHAGRAQGQNEHSSPTTIVFVAVTLPPSAVKVDRSRLSKLSSPTTDSRSRHSKGARALMRHGMPNASRLPSFLHSRFSSITASAKSPSSGTRGETSTFSDEFVTDSTSSDVLDAHPASARSASTTQVSGPLVFTNTPFTALQTGTSNSAE